MRVFLSYARADASLAAAVAEDVRPMGYTVWYDREVAGGQAWWDSILRQIRECDLFIFILTAKSLESQACRAEYGYASRLQKRILPLLCRDGVKINLLPPELSVIQFVDYRAQNKQAAFAFVMALQSMPGPATLPDPLPPQPPVPISYLGDLRAQIESEGDMTLGKQRELLFELKRRLKDPEAREDAFELLRLLRGREELIATIAEEIDGILGPTWRKRRDEFTDDYACPEKIAQSSSPSVNPVPNSRPVTPELAASVTIDLTGESEGLEALVEHVAATSETWVLQAGEDRMSISVEGGELVLAAVFHRWGEKEAKRLKAMGWRRAELGQIGAWAGMGALILATSGIGLALLLHKGTRNYLLKRALMVKRFPLLQQKEAVMEIVKTFPILSPENTRLTASKV